MQKTLTLLIALVINSLVSCVHTVENSAEEDMLLKAHDEINLMQ